MVWMFAMVLLLPLPARAEGPGPSPTPKAVELQAAPPEKQGAYTPKVLDFEGDVIEGENKKPELFLQTESQGLTLDAVLYQRKDFNDFHTVDRNQRPRYSAPQPNAERK